MGLTIAIGPWLVRSAMETGNPIYPYMNGLFRNSFVAEWHRPVPQYSIVKGGFDALVHFFQSITGIETTQNHLYLPEWGIVFSFMILSVFCLGTRTDFTVRLTLIASFLSWICLVCYSSEFRYQMGVVIYSLSVSFAIVLNRISTNRKYFKTIALIVLLLCAFQTFSAYKIWPAMLRNFESLISGYGEGNMKYFDIDKDMANLRWLAYLINTRTKKDEGVLHAGINYAFAVERKFYFSSDLDKQIILCMAEQAETVDELKNNIQQMGVSHLLISSHFLDSLRQPVAQSHTKILDLIQTKMQLRFASPDNSLGWFSFNNGNNLNPIQLNEVDAMNFPVMFIEQAKSAGINGNAAEFERLLETVLRVSIAPENRLYASAILAMIYRMTQRKEKGESLLQEVISEYPKLPVAYANLALFYSECGEASKIPKLVDKVVELDGLNIVKSNPRLVPYLKKEQH